MARQGAFRGWPLGALLRNMKHIPVDRSAGSHAYDEAVRALRDGELVGVFPEGTMSRSFEVQRLKAGAVRLAQAVRVPLIPVAFWDAGRRLGCPAHPREWRQGEGARPGRGHDASDALRAAPQQLTDDLQDIYPVDGAGQW